MYYERLEGVAMKDIFIALLRERGFRANAIAAPENHLEHPEDVIGDAVARPVKVATGKDLLSRMPCYDSSEKRKNISDPFPRHSFSNSPSTRSGAALHS